MRMGGVVEVGAVGGSKILETASVPTGVNRKGAKKKHWREKGRGCGDSGRGGESYYRS